MLFTDNNINDFTWMIKIKYILYMLYTKNIFAGLYLRDYIFTKFKRLIY